MNIDALIRVWNDPPADREAAEKAFAELYHDPVTINGAVMSVAQLAEMAHTLASALGHAERTIVDVIESGDRLAVMFRLQAEHRGALQTRLGPVAATGRPVDVAVVDLFTVHDGLISEVTAITDELGLLMQLGAVGSRPSG